MFATQHFRRVGLSPQKTAGIVATIVVGIALVAVYRYWPPGAATENGASDVADGTADESAAALDGDGSATRDQALAAEIRRIKADLLAELREQLANEQHALPTASAARRTGGAVALPDNPDPARHAEMGRRTLAYWNQLNDIILREEQMRRVPQGGLTISNAGDFLRRRGQANEFAATKIRQLSTAMVDPDVVGIATDIAAWYDRGNQLNDTGSFLLNRADSASRRGQPGQSWQEGEKQQRASVAEINRRGDEIRQRMIRKYGLSFPNLR